MNSHEDLSVIDASRPDTYRWLTWIYDRLAHLVFQGAILQSQRELLAAHDSVLGSCQHVVWLGGGTGRLLNDLLISAPYAQVTYIEASASMMSRATREVEPQHQHRVRWIHQDHRWLWGEQAQAQLPAIDILITAFFLDVLPEDDCRELAQWAQLKVKRWLFADFIPQKRFWARKLIELMYVCFTITTRIEQREMLDLIGILSQEGWEHLNPFHTRVRFARGLIHIDSLTSTKQSSLGDQDG